LLKGAVFFKSAAVIADAAYPDFGCNFEIFTNPEFLELETLGPQVELRLEESVRHIETWTLFQNVPNGKDDGWIREAVAPLAFTS
jgi:hypothetical protein